MAPPPKRKRPFRHRRIDSREAQIIAKRHVTTKIGLPKETVVLERNYLVVHKARVFEVNCRAPGAKKHETAIILWVTDDRKVRVIEDLHGLTQAMVEGNSPSKAKLPKSAFTGL